MGSDNDLWHGATKEACSDGPVIIMDFELEASWTKLVCSVKAVGFLMGFNNILIYIIPEFANSLFRQS